MSQGDYVNKTGIYDWFERKQKEEKQKENKKEKAKMFLDELNQSAERYRQLIDGKGDSSIQAMKHLRFRQTYIVLLACMNLPPIDRAKIHKLLETIAFSYVITGSKTNALEKRFCEISKIARDAESEPEKIEEVINSLKEIVNDIKELVKVSLRYFKYKGRGDKNKVFYLLTKLAQSLDDADYSSYTIEHILCQNTDLPTDIYEKTVCSIGNLTLLTHSDNSALKDKPFSEKKPIYQTQSCRLTKSIVSVIDTGTINTKFDKAIKAFGYNFIEGDNWNEEEIKLRTESLINLTEYIWFDSV